MPDVGRFFNIDVLAEDYDYQTPYAFSENKVINHIELEGLEGVLIGPGGIPLPPPPPIYGSRTTGMHPIGQRPVRLSDVTDAARSATRGISKGVSDIAIVTTALVLVNAMNTFDNVTSLWSSVMNSESDSNSDKKKTTLEKNKSKGKKAEKEVSGELAQEFPDDVVESQVTGKFKDGKTTVFDDVVVDGKTGKVKGTNETKTGGARLTKPQKRYRNGERVELTGKNAGSAKGQKINVNEIPDRVTRR